MDVPQHLQLYTERYFTGDRAISGYDDYANCRGVLENWGRMVRTKLRPTSLLDVGAAYGFLVEYFQAYLVPAAGIEPSEWALSQVPVGVPVFAGALPELSTDLDPTYDVVTCTEVLEHVPEALVGGSLAALADRTGRLLVCIIMLDGPGAVGDAGHICLKSRAWWDEQFRAHTTLTQRPALEAQFDGDYYARHMGWAGRVFIYER